MIALGLGEVTKVALIIIGVGPTIALDTYLNAKGVPREHILASMTLGASKSEVMWRVILPQLKPKIVNSIRLNLKGLLLFLIAGESLAAAVGLGYRIFVVQRFFAMDVIIGYVICMAAGAFALDMLLRGWNWYRYSWNGKGM
jgi:NitT/TauT family transport system permease protein